MTGFDIVLILIAMVCIVVSFMLSEKLDHNTSENQISDETLAALLSRNQESMKQSLEEYLMNVKEDLIEDTVQELNRISNEKIMAVDEFSNTVLEKINENHSEVVFMYNMLNEKEKDLKGLVFSKGTNVELKAQDKPGNEQSIVQKNSSKKTRSRKQSSKSTHSGNEQITPQKEENGDKTRQEILKAYEEGKSIVEIAQTLDLGQGEVKLIIDLYQGGKNE